MATRDLADASPALVEKYEAVKFVFEATFPKFEIRPTCVYRSVDEQKAEFDAGRSAIDGVTKLGNHNYHPSRAIDIGIFQKNGAKLPSSYLDDLLEAGRINQVFFDALHWVVGMLAKAHGLRWGGDWRDEGTFCAHSPKDPYHLELREAAA